MRIALILSLFTLSLLQGLAQASLPVAFNKSLSKHHIPASSVSVLVVDVESNVPLLSLNINTARNPASVMKLVTTLAALEILGPTYTWPTHYYLDGKLDNGRLKGDVIIKGHGDPYLVIEQFWRHLMSLRERGLKTIDGNLGIDNSSFAPDTHDPAAFDRSPFRLYNVGSSATLVNFNATRFGFYPQDGIVNIIVDPPMDNLHIIDRLRAEPGKCINKERGWSHQITPQHQSVNVTFSGKYTSRCGDYDLRRSVLAPDDYVFGAFKTTWENVGGTLTGHKRLRAAPAGLKPFVIGGSKPLAEVIKGTNKYSNNLMARQLLMTLGLKNSGAPATAQKGINAIQDWLLSNKIDLPEWKMENGSGLSRDIRLSAKGLVNLLKHAWVSPYRPEFLSSLSITAVDGTTRKRLRKLHPDGRVRLKTGYLKSNRSVAGYITGTSGKTYAVALLINDSKIQIWSGNQIQDVLFKWLLQQ